MLQYLNVYVFISLKFSNFWVETVKGYKIILNAILLEK
jgi:hypothetical protein